MSKNERLNAVYNAYLNSNNADEIEIGILKLKCINISDDLLVGGNVGHLSGDCQKRDGYLNRNGKFVERV